MVRRGFGEGFSDKAQRRCPAGRRIGSGRPPAQHKSISGGSLFPAPAAIVPDQEPESHLAEVGVAEGHAGQVGGPGSSGNAKNDSHLAEVDAAESHAGQVDGPGSSGNAENGSHLEATDAAEGHARQVGGSGGSATKRDHVRGGG